MKEELKLIYSIFQEINSLKTNQKQYYRTFLLIYVTNQYFNNFLTLCYYYKAVFKKTHRTQRKST